MSPDRKRLWGFGPKEASNSEFKIIAQGGDLIYRWIGIKQAIAKNEMLNSPVSGNGSIEIGTFRTEDEVLEGVGAAVQYKNEDLEYNLLSIIVTTEDQSKPQPPEMPNISSILMGDRLEKRRLEEQAQRYHDQMHKYYRETLEEIGEILKEKGFDSELSEDDHVEKLTIINRNQPSSTQINLSVEEQNRDSYTLSFSNSKLGSKEDFSKEYQEFAKLTEEVVNAFYDLSGKQPPAKTVEMKPTKNLESKLDVAEDSIKQRRKLLSAGGLIDSDEEIQREIDEKIELIEKPTETFEDIGGNDEAKEQLQIIIDALKTPQSYARWGTDAPQGVLLFGEPGTGKTMLAKALANAAGVGIYVVELADVLHSLYGKTERLLNAVFEKARKNAPVIILIDELDALAGNRNQSNEVTSRIVTVLNTNLSGLAERPQGIVVVGTTNRVDAIDPAIKRPGRLDMLINVPMPNPEQRAKIFELKMKKAQQKAEAAGGGKIFNSLNVDELIKKTDNFSGADIEEVVRRALAIKVREEARGQTPTPVTTEDLLAVISTYETVRKEKRLGFLPPSSKNGA